MQKLKNNAPCICGHSNINHMAQQFYLKAGTTIDTRRACGVLYCECIEFKMDNLKYLEREDETRKPEL